LLLIQEHEGFVLDGFVGGQEDGAAGETGFDGVERDFGFAGVTGGAGGGLGVEAVGVDLCGGRHLGDSLFWVFVFGNKKAPWDHGGSGHFFDA
jgi:hypothetical protein